MEKRKIVAPTPSEKDDTPLQMAHALRAVSESSLLSTEVAVMAQRAIFSELATHSGAIQAIAKDVMTRPKIIDVTVTERDTSGRPSKYRIEVK